MAGLPSQHPRLALHLSDRALTPIISSSTSSLSPNKTHPQSSSSPPLPPSSKRPRAAFSTSPPSSPDSSIPSSDEVDDDDDNNSSAAGEGEEDGEIDPQTLQSISLAHLTTTALASYDTAKRLNRGAPLRTMIEYPGAGPVVLHSYLCPMSLALGVPGRPRRGSDGSMATTVGMTGDGGEGHGGSGGGDEAGDRPIGNGKQAVVDGTETATRPERQPLQAAHLGLDENDLVKEEDDDGPNAPPMLITTVIASSAEEIRDARRAAGRLERIARVFHTDWAAEGGDAT